jgi:hypothetical protein
MAGEVTYHQANESITSADGARESAQQPVVGKTYVVERTGDELQISTPQGEIPPQEEFEIVWHNMESFGKPNPLADFLAGRTVAVGQVLEVPADAAAELLAFGEDVVQVERFSLTLKQIEDHEGRQTAVFQAFVSSRSHGQSQMGMQVEGSLAVDAATCRVRTLELSGPIGLTETRTSGADTYLVSGRGKIHVAMRGEYREARQ